MNRFASHVALHARHQFTRHLRSPAIWVLALAGPVAARFLVPKPGASYSMVGVNDAILRPSASVIGLQLGVLIAVLLAPLAYIFLKAGPTRVQPRQVTDITPGPRSALTLGQWLGDVGALWLLMLSLAVAGVILSIFRLPFTEVSPMETVVSLSLIAGPALGVIAAVRTVLGVRPRLRRAGGDVMFFFLWIAALLVSASFFMGGEGGVSPMMDMFGFAAPLASGTSEPITALYIGGAPGTERLMDFDGMAGVSDPGFLLSRLAWLVVAGGSVWAAGFFYRSGRVRPNGAGKISHHGPPVFSNDALQPVVPAGSGVVPKVRAFIADLIRPRWMGPLLGVVSLAGLFLPLRGAVGPALALILIFPLTLYGSRWRDRSITSWVRTLPASEAQIFLLGLVTACGVCLLLLLPSLPSLPSGQWTDILAIGVGLPLIAIGLGHVTRGPVAARLVLLMLWYGYLNIGDPPI